MAKWDKTVPAQGPRTAPSKEVRDNMQALDEALMAASAKAQATPDLTLAVGPLEHLAADLITRKSFAGGNSPSIVAPTTNPRIALLVLNTETDVLSWVYGTEAASPSPPLVPVNAIGIVEVFERVGQTSITNEDDTANAFIKRVFPKLVSPAFGTPGSVLFVGANGARSQDNPNLFWDNTNKRLGIGTTTPSGVLSLVGGTPASVTFPAIDIMNDRIITWRGSSGGVSDSGFVWYTSANQLNFGTGNNTRMELLLGLKIGAPTGGDKGAGSLNLADKYYKNGDVLAQIILKRVGARLTASSTAYGESMDATEASAELVCSNPGTVRRLFLRTTEAQPASGSLVVTMRKNGAATAVTLTVAAGAAAGNFSDTTNSFTVVAGDRVTPQFVNNATDLSALMASFAFAVEIG